jgi:hypothetical protein
MRKEYYATELPPSFYACVTTVETCVGAAAKLRQTTRTRRRCVAARINLQLFKMKPEIFTLSRCISAGMFFSCCDSVAVLPALANCNEHAAKTNTSQPHPPTPRRFARRPQHERLEW